MKAQNRKDRTILFTLLIIFVILAVVISVFIAIYPNLFKEELNADIDDEHWTNREFLNAKKVVNKTLPMPIFFDNQTSPCVNYYGYSCGNFKLPQNLAFGSLAVEIADLNEHSITSALPDASHPITQFFRQCTDALLGNQELVAEGLLMEKLRFIQDTPNIDDVIEHLHSIGIVPFTTFIRDDDVLRWNRSAWTKEIPRLTQAGCGYLETKGFVKNRNYCVVNIHLMYQQFKQIFQANAHAEILTSSQMYSQFPLLYTQEYAGKHKLWSPIQMLSLNLMIKDSAFLRMYLQLIVTLDSSAFIPSIWHGEDHYLSYTTLIQRPSARHARDFFYFRNGFGPFGLDASRKHADQVGKGTILQSCLFLTEQMLPHLNQELVISKEDHDSARVIVDETKDFLKTIISKSRNIYPSIKKFLLQRIEETQVVLGFPGETPQIAWSSLSFLEMVWEIRRFQVSRQMNIVWPPSLLAGSCDSEIMIHDRTIFIPMCLYQNNWFRELLITVLYHEWAHLLDPRVLEQLGAPKDGIAIMKSTLSKFGNPTLEHFADIIGLRLAYEFCKSRNSCRDAKEIRSFLIKNAQMWCNGNNDPSIDPEHGTDEDRMRNAFYFLLDMNNVHPLSVAYQCSQNALFFQTVVPFF
jgi:hypothetical protein